MTIDQLYFVISLVATLGFAFGWRARHEHEARSAAIMVDLIYLLVANTGIFYFLIFLMSRGH